jgi:hypothetical protein
MPMLRASPTGPWHNMTMGIVNPMDMWRFSSSVYPCQLQRLREMQGEPTAGFSHAL